MGRRRRTHGRYKRYNKTGEKKVDGDQSAAVDGAGTFGGATEDGLGEADGRKNGLRQQPPRRISGPPKAARMEQEGGGRRADHGRNQSVSWHPAAGRETAACSNAAFQRRGHWRSVGGNSPVLPVEILREWKHLGELQWSGHEAEDTQKPQRQEQPKEARVTMLEKPMAGKGVTATAAAQTEYVRRRPVSTVASCGRHEAAAFSKAVISAVAAIGRAVGQQSSASGKRNPGSCRGDGAGIC